VESLFTRKAFSEFGPIGLAADPDAPPLHQLRARKVARLRALARQHVPRRPGVYGMVDLHGELIYVGKAKCLRSRLLGYFRPRSRDPKAGRILRRTRTLVWEETPCEFAALLRELELIRRWQPRFNVQGQPQRRRRTYVCLGRRPAPYVFLNVRPPANALACFGPIPAGPKAREAVRRVNDWFRLRDCPQAQEMIFTDQGELFPVLRAAGCLRHEIGTCSAPCAGVCTHAGYREQVNAARAFLTGENRTPLEHLEKEMTLAAAALAFERAAALRDRLESLRWLVDSLDRVRTARERNCFVYPVTGHNQEEIWYLVQASRVMAMFPAPRDEPSRQQAHSALQAVYGVKPAPPACATTEEIDGILLVASWFRRHPEELAKTVEPAAAKQVLTARLETIRDPQNQH